MLAEVDSAGRVTLFHGTTFLRIINKQGLKVRPVRHFHMLRKSQMIGDFAPLFPDVVIAG